MAKKKVEFPFIKVFDLKGLNATQKLFLCRVWSFQSNNRKCYITNNTWADYLGVSPSVVKTMKKELREFGYINKYIQNKNNIYLIDNIEDLMKNLSQNYNPKYAKEDSEESIEVIGNSEISHLNIGNSNLPAMQNELTLDQNKPKVGENEPMEVQIGHQLDNTLDYKLNYLKDNQLDIETWTLESFNHKNITSINQIDFDITNSVEIRNNVLSYWYNCFSDIQLKKSILLFLDENYFNIFTRILRGTSTGKIKSEYLIELNINTLFELIEIVYNDQLAELEPGSYPTKSNVTNSVILTIQDDKLEGTGILKK